MKEQRSDSVYDSAAPGHTVQLQRLEEDLKALKVPKHSTLTLANRLALAAKLCQHLLPQRQITCKLAGRRRFPLLGLHWSLLAPSLLRGRRALQTRFTSFWGDSLKAPMLLFI